MIVIRDDIGEAWEYKNGRIVLVGDNSEGGGYACDSFEAGIILLNEMHYISPPDKIEMPDLI